MLDVVELCLLLVHAKVDFYQAKNFCCVRGKLRYLMPNVIAEIA